MGEYQIIFNDFDCLLGYKTLIITHSQIIVVVLFKKRPINSLYLPHLLLVAGILVL